jgi:hypothetical protein
MQTRVEHKLQQEAAQEEAFSSSSHCSSQYSISDKSKQEIANCEGKEN